MGSGGTDDVGAGWGTARVAGEVALLSEEITAARVTALRHAVAAAARSAGLVGHGLEDFVLAVHELVTNVVRHGGGSGEVRLWQHHDVLTCQVSDDGPGLGEVAVALPSPGGGRPPGTVAGAAAHRRTDGRQLRTGNDRLGDGAAAAPDRP